MATKFVMRFNSIKIVVAVLGPLGISNALSCGNAINLQASGYRLCTFLDLAIMPIHIFRDERKRRRSQVTEHAMDERLGRTVTRVVLARAVMHSRHHYRNRKMVKGVEHQVGKYSEDDAKAVLIQILNVVAFCRLHGVVHRDSKTKGSKANDKLSKKKDKQVCLNFKKYKNSKLQSKLLNLKRLLHSWSSYLKLKSEWVWLAPDSLGVLYILPDAIVENNTVAFRNMDEQDKQMIERKLGNTTALHLASRIGNAEIGSIILLLRPEMVDAENDNLETPLHEACRMGHEKVVRSGLNPKNYGTATSGRATVSHNYDRPNPSWTPPAHAGHYHSRINQQPNWPISQSSLRPYGLLHLNQAQQPTVAEQQSNQMVYPLQYASPHPGQGVLGLAPAHYACDSSGDLYPVTKPSTTPTTFLSTSTSTWHQRLGHPGDEVLCSLVSRLFISYSIVGHCFDIIHYDNGHPPLPASVNMVRSMWLFKHKFHADGTLSRYKARLVANGSSQQLGVDFDETFSPVVKPATIYTVLNLVVSRKWPIHQLGVKNAFLNGDLSETVYMHQPPGFVDARFPNHVCRLQRSLYGLKQAPRAWFQCFAGLFLSQRKYALQLLKHAQMVNCNPSRTPVDTESKLGPDGVSVQDPTLYRSLTGGLQYLTFTRPDLSYAVQQICLYMHDPREPHLAALKRILRYVKGNLDLGLHLYASATTSLVGCIDADWAGFPSIRRSTLGYCVFLDDNLLSWSAKRQHTLSRSSAEAEYWGVANVVAETAWLCNLLRELHSLLSTATLVYYDNVSAVYMSANPVQHQRVKHIEIDIHFVRDMVTAGQMVQTSSVNSLILQLDCNSKDLINSLDLRNPLHLHNSDFNDNNIISVKLTGTENYRFWVAAMKLVLSWLLNSVSEDLFLSQIFSDNASEFFMGLNDVFQPIRSCLLSRETLPDVKDAFTIVSREESHRGLASSSFGSVTKPQVSSFVSKSNNWSNNGGGKQTAGIKFAKPPPDLFTKPPPLKRHHQTAACTSCQADNNKRFGNSRNNRGLNPNLHCTNCQKVGHTVDRCFDIIGYPLVYVKNPGLKSTGTRTFNVNSVSSSNEKGASLSFTNEQMLKLMNLINDSSSGSVQANMAEYCVSMLYVNKLIKDSRMFMRLGHPSDQAIDMLHQDLNFTMDSHVSPCEQESHFLLVIIKPLLLFNCNIKTVRSDNGTEFVNNKMNVLFNSLVFQAPNDEGSAQPCSSSADDSEVDLVTSMGDNSSSEGSVPSNSGPLSQFDLPGTVVKAMNNEIEALNRNDTWTICDIPPRRKGVGSKWLWKIKYKFTGEIERYKARVVSKSFSQREGFDYLETFSPVVKMSTVRYLTKDVYMTLPHGFDNDKSKSKYAYSLFTKKSNNVFIMLLVYVDDIVITENDVNETDKFKVFLKSKFQIKDLGKLKYFLEIEVLDNKDGICLSQKKYCLELLHEYGLLAGKPVETPLTENTTLNHVETNDDKYWYLKSSLRNGIQINRNAYADSDWVRCLAIRKSVSSYCVFLGDSLVTLKSLLPVVMYCDNSSALQIAANPVFHEKSKHFKIDVHLVREKVASGVIKIEKIHSS
nr:ribonuclease H-like domain-containing protein [Tanacetum cinerariifolium]